MLEVAIDRIVDNQKPFSDAKVIFVTCNESKELKDILKFEKIKIEEQKPHLQDKDSLQVFNLQEVCAKYCVEPLQSGYLSWFSSFFLP